MFRGKGRNRALNIGARAGIIEEVSVQTFKSRRRKRKGARERALNAGDSGKERELRKCIGRKGEALRWSYDGNGVRHTLQGRRGWVVRGRSAEKPGSIRALDG